MPSTVLMVSDFIQASAHGSSAAAKVSSSLYSHQGSGEINYNPQNRWYLPDGIEVTAQAFDTIFINGRQSNSSSIIPMQRIDLEKIKEVSFVCASADYPMELELDSHRMILLEIDGFPVTPVAARRLFLQPGETARVKFEKMVHLDGVAERDTFLFRANAAGMYK